MKKQLMASVVLGLAMGATSAHAGVVQEQQAQIDDLLARVAVLESQNSSMAALLSGVSRIDDTLLLTGMNLQIVNGLGATDGDTGEGPEVNGLGNLVIGYDTTYCPEIGDCWEKTGSHNLVIGDEHGYTSFGGVVAGTRNRSYASHAVVLGGFGSLAEGHRSVVIGGQNGAAMGTFSGVFGGEQNIAAEWWSVVSGGYFNYASGYNSSVFGGFQNDATANGASVTGGYLNEASGPYSTVSGGMERDATGTSDWVAGGLFQDN